jgi:hypothetical protein
MARQHWGLVVGVVCVVAACGGRAANGDGVAGGAGAAPSVESGNGAIDNGAATGGESAGAKGDSGGEAGADTGCRGELNAIKATDVECPAELCAGTVSALACDALPAGVVKTSEAACDQKDGQRVRTLTFELSSTRRKACYYEQADDFEAPALLVGARVWEDKETFCDRSASQVSAGVVPSTDCFDESSATLCDLTDPTQSAPVRPNVPARACFNGFSATCEPCCDTTPPDCTSKPQDYPGYDCTPSGDDGGVSYCSCSCDHQQWTCEC